MSYNLSNSWQKHTPQNLQQTQLHSPPHLVSDVRTVPCRIYQRFLWHTVGLQRQIWSLHRKVKLSHQITMN